jgi:hypothetical protein
MFASTNKALEIFMMSPTFGKTYLESIHRGMGNINQNIIKILIRMYQTKAPNFDYKYACTQSVKWMHLERLMSTLYFIV